MSEAVKRVAAALDRLDALDLTTCAKEQVAGALSNVFDAAGDRYRRLGVAFRDTNAVWHRGRLMAESEPVPTNLRDILYRSPPCAQGRANYITRTVFYAAWNHATVIAELDPKSGQRLESVQVRLQQGSTLNALTVGAYEHFFVGGRTFYPSDEVTAYMNEFFLRAPDEIVRVTLLVDSYLAAVMSNPGQSKYPISCALAEWAYEIGGGYQSVIYPSVKKAPAVNIAMPKASFDNCFEVVRASGWQVGETYGRSSYYPLNRLRETHLFAENGSIDWYPKVQLRPPMFSMQNGYSYPRDWPAWRVPINWR